MNHELELKINILGRVAEAGSVMLNSKGCFKVFCNQIKEKFPGLRFERLIR